MENKKFYKKKCETHIIKEWSSEYSFSYFDDGGLTVVAFNKFHLFHDEHHTCLMAKERKVFPRETLNYTSSSDESSEDKEEYNKLFKGLHRSKVDKINELIDALNEKDKYLEKQ